MNDETQRQKWHPITWVVIAIGSLAVLLAIAIPSFVNWRNEVGRQACIDNMRMTTPDKTQGSAAGQLKEENTKETNANHPSERIR